MAPEVVVTRTPAPSTSNEVAGLPSWIVPPSDSTAVASPHARRAGSTRATDGSNQPPR